MGSSTYFRQYEVLLQKNAKLLLRRPLHLLVLLLSSVVSVIFAWLAGRDAMGPSGEFPPLTNCGAVDPFYYAQVTRDQTDWETGWNIPLSLNEPWRSGLPVWLMSLGPTFAAISVFWILRDEISSRRWGTLRSAGLRDSVYWMSWFTAFAVLAIINSLLGGITAKFLPDCHAFNSVNYASIFGSLVFLNGALTTASFFLSALCGTCKSAALSVFIIMAIIVASAAPVISTSINSTNVYVSGYYSGWGGAGSFWAYTSTEQTSVYYGGDYFYNETLGDYEYVAFSEPTVSSYQEPIISYEQSRIFGNDEENLERYSKADFFQGCYVSPGASAMFRPAWSYLFWFFVPQAHFMMAWSNILGYTSLPGNTFGFTEASISPEILATEALLKYKGGAEPLYDANNTNGTSLFPQGSTISTEYYYRGSSCDYVEGESDDDYWGYGGSWVCNSNCPPEELTDISSGSSTCVNAAKGYPLPGSGSPSYNDAIGLLFAVTSVYSILAAYFSAVFPMGNGSPMKFYFPFLPAYWLGTKGRNSEEENNDEDEEKGAEDNDPVVGVKAENVSKKYGKVEALKSFSLNMRKGEVTALLGHNGAGKSTFTNLLCCEQNATSGDISVLGRSVKNDKMSVRHLIGECKQDDFLWPDLSAKEHLELFGGVRGLSKADAPHTVQKWLESVDLDVVKNDYSSSFSGGMKRRLSLAIATIGDAPVLVLDEPTTGMDPVSRRLVWKHITEIKPNRVILLTTHAMEEADLLSDHVAILNQGEIVAFGSPLELKSKYGSAIQFSLIAEKDRIGTVEEYVKETFSDTMEWVNIKSGQSGFITLTIKKIARQDDTNEEGVPVTVLSDFIRFLEADNSPVSEFGISNSSLEEVFLAVTNTSTPDTDITEETGCCRCCSCCCCCRRQRRRAGIEAESTETSDASSPQPRVNFEEQPKVDLALYERKLSVPTQIEALLRFYVARSWWSGKSSIFYWLVVAVFVSLNVVNGFGMAHIYDPTGGGFYDFSPMLFTVTIFVLSFILILVITPLYHDRKKGLFKMMSTQSLLASSYLCGISIYSMLVYAVYSFITLTLFYGSSIFRNAIIANYSYDWESWRFSSPPVIYPMTVFSTQVGDEVVSVRAHAGPAGYEFIFLIIVIFTLTAPGSTLSSAFLPGYRLPLVLISVILLAACVAPVILMTTELLTLDEYFASNCTALVESTARCSNEFEDLFESYSPISAEVVSTTVSTSANALVECVGWAVSNPFILCTPPVVSILPQFGLFQTLALTIMSNVVFTSEPNEAYAKEVFIPSLIAGGASCSSNSCDFPFVRNMYGENLGYMLLGGIALLILGIGMVGIFLFPPRCMVNMRHRIRCRLSVCRKKKNIDTDSTESEFEELNEVDEERKAVTSMMQQIVNQPDSATSAAPVLSYSSRNANKESLPPVLMHRLRKEFPSKVALNSLDLHVERGRVLGLLGKNGAGKTTALKIMAGMYDSSGGIGLVAGFDVEAERIKVYNNLGNCPQFDCVWDNQSVCRHLEFYARLKGIKDPIKAAKEIAVAVGLGERDVYTRRAASLSGGMRRRLSIAMSLLGSPNVLFLDEPTTGLDPSTRNEIWGLLSSFATPERAVIITTHMMLEADALCSRIAIVAKGNLKVVGTNQHLKDNYGSGYLLQLNLAQITEESVNSALQFVKDNINEDAKIVTKQAKTIHINLPRDVSVEKIFSVLYSDDSTGCGINQFLVSQSSLEDVFIALGE